MTDARQRAREAALLVLRDAILNEKGYIARAIEAYFDERMRCDASDPIDGLIASNLTTLESQLAEELGTTRAERTHALARIAELEAVVRAADAMRAALTVGGCACGICSAMREGVLVYDAARAKVTVPGE